MDQFNFMRHLNVPLVGLMLWLATLYSFSTIIFLVLNCGFLWSDALWKKMILMCLEVDTTWRGGGPKRAVLQSLQLGLEPSSDFLLGFWDFRKLSALRDSYIWIVVPTAVGSIFGYHTIWETERFYTCLWFNS